MSRPELILGHQFTVGERTFIIAEIGQNHQGNIDTAKFLIQVAKESGADCVKFQKTCVEEKFTQAAMDKPYVSEHSFGATYGEHKKFLEFNDDEFLELQAHAEEVGIMFASSAMDCVSLQLLYQMKVPFVKIGSGDCNNLQLIEQAARLQIPLLISTGMQSFKTVQKVYHLVKQHHTKFAFLHCVSTYPAPPEDLNLNTIKYYRRKFPDIHIGYSGHEMGLQCISLAVSCGAVIIERHLTMNIDQKGSDHLCSLDPKQFKEMVTRIRDIEPILGVEAKFFKESERACSLKLNKSLVSARSLKSGHVLEAKDLKIKVSSPPGIDAVFFDDILGELLVLDVPADDPIVNGVHIDFNNDYIEQI